MARSDDVMCGSTRFGQSRFEVFGLEKEIKVFGDAQAVHSLKFAAGVQREDFGARVDDLVVGGGDVVNSLFTRKLAAIMASAART